MSDDPFDLGGLRIDPAQIARNEGAARRRQEAAQLKRVAKDGAFVILPYELMLAEAGRQGNASLAVLIELAYLTYHGHSRTVPLPNARFKAVGISHDAKVDALRRLEAGGAVTVDWRGSGQSPLVTFLWTHKPPLRSEG